MSIIQGGAKSASRGFYPNPIDQSLRFNDDDSAYLSRTQASGTFAKWTQSFWFKRGNIGVTQIIRAAYVDSNNRGSIFFDANDRIQIFRTAGGVQTIYRVTTQVFRDPSAWYHIVVIFDSNNATPNDRIKLYVNGEQVTSFSTTNNPSSGDGMYINLSSATQYLGWWGGSGSYFDGYLAEVHFTDGTAYDADAFGEFKNGVWVAKAPDVTYGTNGFYLTFEDDTEVEAFNTVLWRGDGSSSRSITGMGFQPDLVWIKNRSAGYWHNVSDAVRGTNKVLYSNETSAEQVNEGNGYLSAFDSDGFTVQAGGSGSHNINNSGSSYVAWGWKAGDSNVSNTDGSITSTVRANQTYGFSIVSYTGNGTSGATVGHGLSSAPELVFVKRRDAASNWSVASQSISASQVLFLNSTSGATTDPGPFASTHPSSSVITLGSSTDTNASSGTFIAYCWAEKTGYSKFGSYTGDGTTSNSITGLGFKPAWLMVKRTDAADNWAIYDATRDTVDPREKYLYADSSNAEATFSTAKVSFDDDGFTWLGAVNFGNASGGTYIYAAFADTREAAFWLDQSGNDNDWQPVNLDHNDTVADSPTDNFATMNPLRSNTITLSNGNLQTYGGAGSSGDVFTTSTIWVSSGQWYVEVDYIAKGSGSALNVGIIEHDSTHNYPDYGYFSFNGQKYQDTTGSAYGATWDVGDTIGIALDLDAGTLIFTKNGVSQGTAFTGLSGLFAFSQARFGSDSHTALWNFGQQPFKYDPPA